MSFQIIHNDITLMETDAIVNAANCQLLPGGGVCGAIFKKAGYHLLNQACAKLSPIQTGNAVITPGFDLKAKYVIHAVGPVYQDGNHQEKPLLQSAYRNSLKLAKDYHLSSISFPLISSGIYGYPKKEALEIAVSVIKQFLRYNEMDIYLVVFDRKSVKISEELYNNVKHYIDSFFDERIDFQRKQQLRYDSVISTYLFKEECLEELLNNKKETFSQMLLRFIDEKGYSDVETYKKANIDRKLFSKIKSHCDYQPKKTTVISFAIALELNIDQTNDLLNTAGYSLSNSKKGDIIVRYFIENRIYDIYQLNETLFCFDQKIL
ncbi:MAG: macro domain-containing protein [Faecalibacillus sp.]